jgi:hypothetical protein
MTTPQVDPEVPAEPPGRRPGRNRMAGAAIAAIVFAITTIVLLRSPAFRSDESLLRLPDETGGPPAPGEDGQRFERALTRYKHEDDAGAARQLEAPFASPPLEPLRRLYRASALLALGRRDAAATVLDSVPADTPLPGPYADWRAWAELHLSSDPGALARRDSLVRALAERPGPLQDEARAVLAATGHPPAPRN